jgi:replicative DNA helicase
MDLSAPVYYLKRKARHLARARSIPLHEALDCVAKEEGFGSWSLLAAKASARSPARTLFGRLANGDLVVVGARPGQGKTLMSLGLAVEAMKRGQRGALFSLEYTAKDVQACFRTMNVRWQDYSERFRFDDSDAISAAYIIEKLADEPEGTVVVVDYLQLLDQRRSSPELGVQIQELRSFAKARGLIMVFISQIDRSFNSAERQWPDSRDIRLPNPVDLRLFDKMCFISNGKVRIQSSA